jgi:Ca2+/Na+ antiporter
MVILLAVYLLNVKKQNVQSSNAEDKERKVERLFSYQKLLAIGGALVGILGFTIYLIEKKREYGKKFDIKQFIIGRTSCKYHTPKSVRIL